MQVKYGNITQLLHQRNNYVLKK